MRPAFSVIFLTTLIGMGQGVFLAQIFTIANVTFADAPQLPDSFFVATGITSLALLAAGLVASVFHLGRPSRAWRAASQWRTSWLSREVILLPLCMASIFVASFIVPGSALVALIGVLLCFGLYVATGMIYACLRFIPQWYSAWTPINFILMGVASGLTLTSAIAAVYAPEWRDSLGYTAILVTTLAFFGRLLTLRRNAMSTDTSTLQSATGIKANSIKQISQGSVADSFVAREFAFQVTTERMMAVKSAFQAFGFGIPILLIFYGLETNNMPVLIAASITQYAGFIAERWYFFAEAKHPQRLYYQTKS